MLDLTHNSITTLTSSVFKNLVKLTWLSLSDNEITVVESFSFKSLGRLRHLDLSFNQLTEKVGLQNDCLNDLKHLHHLALAGNRAVRRMPHFHRMGFPRNSTTSLDLHGMPMIAEIGENAFRGFVSLSILNLSYCGIETIEPGWLNNGPMNSIRTLDLSYNRLKLVESHYFVGIQFDPVFFSENSFGFSSPEDPLSYIVSPNNVHEAVADFSTGAFSYHVTTVASRSVFGPLPNLHLISLRNNRRLSVLAEDAFSFVPALKYL
uniref:Uncharacterized protein n=1 Tax=Ciona savignyi TaxID=51511 RepID=H2YYS8_CIOSA